MSEVENLLDGVYDDLEADMQQQTEDDVENQNVNEEPSIKRGRKMDDIDLQQSIQQLCQVSQSLFKKVSDLEKEAKIQVQTVDEECAMINATSSFQSKAFEKQFTINTKVLCLLRRGESKEAMRVLTERNAVLKLADKDPRVLQLVDAREATQELEALAKPLSKDVRDLISSERDGRKRRFLGASNFNARGFAGSAYQGPYGQARRSMPRLLDLNVQTPRGCCYSCQGFGHFANRCPEKKFNSKRQY